ncbi:MAG TPA: carboxypeptidase regulatory-like domain-containing protein [Pyrinomonadaceae bacterium]|nr:carboxypeptidase regulatory-like domain-containing protein [Pyrinomonadaceae bacterium]
MFTEKSRKFSAALFVTVVILAGVHAQAQQTMTSASLSGHVEDAGRALVAGTSVALKNVNTGWTQTTTSDGAGRFRFPYVQVGTYEITVDEPGFARLVRQLTLTVGQALDLPLKLTLADVTENVNVAADLPLVETVRTQVAETLLQREIDSLPLNGRNYLDLAALTPGVARSNPVANQRFPETSAVPGTGLSITGQRFINNGLVVDGLSANDDAADLPGTFFSQEVVREFEVITSGGIAEFGRASGGFVSIVTQSGTNQFHGRLYGFLRNQRFDARNPLASTKDALTQGQYGGSLGGPFARNRSFFFANFEQTRLHNASVITISPTNVAAINGRLDAVGFSGPRISTGIAATGFNSTNVLLRVDHQPTNNNQLTARYSFYDIDSPNARNVGGLNAISRGTALKDRDQTLALSDVATLSARTINEARFQYTRSRLSAPLNDVAGPAVNISGVANFGAATVSPTIRDLDTYELVDNVTTQLWSHSLKFGANYLHNKVNITFPGALQGVYSFSSLANFLANRYTTFQQAFGAIDQFQSNPNIGLFMQDEWRPRQDLTINAGLRYDVQFLPDLITTDANNFAPRLGIAYAPGDRRTVVRASFGIYFDRIPLRATSNALQRDGSKYKVAVLSFGQAGAPVFPNVLAAFPSDLLISITTIDPNISNSYNQQASLQVERELFPSTSLAVGYLHTRGLHLILSRNVNVPRFPAAAGVPNLGRPDPRLANVSRFESSGESSYNGLTIAVNRRFQRWFGARLSYTFSKAIDNAGNAFFFTPQDNSNLRDERGPSDNDQRHRLALSGTFEVPAIKSASIVRRSLSGFQLSYIFSYGSALPFNTILGNDRNFDTNSNDRPVGVGRNSGKGFDFASLDLRLSRRFSLGEKLQLETLVEGFNVLNRANLQLPNNVTGTGPTPLPNFGQPTGAADPRQLQFGLRLSF